MTDTIKKEYKNKKNNSLIYKLDREERYTMRNTLRTLEHAINEAESIDFPNRKLLLEIYHDIMKDAHLKSVVRKRRSRIKGLQYQVIKTSTNNIDNKATELMNQHWFNLYLDYVLEAMDYGNSLIEILNNKNEVDITLIPRENVIPEFKQIKVHSYQLLGDIDYSANIYNKSLIDVNNNFNSRDLGDFISVAKLVLMKNEILLNWSQYLEIFGQPLRVATSDTEDVQELNQIFTLLKELGRSGTMVKNSSTEIDFVESDSKGDASNLYKEIEVYFNNEISKAIVGGTMLTDDGSSYSQAEVQERGLNDLTKQDIRFVENITNNQLIPLLRSKGLIDAKNLKFKFEIPEIITIDEKLKIDQFLIDNFDLDISYFKGRYNIDDLKYKTKKEIN